MTNSFTEDGATDDGKVPEGSTEGRGDTRRFDARLISPANRRKPCELMWLDARHRTESRGSHFPIESQTRKGEALRRHDEFSYFADREFAGKDAPPVLHKEELVFTDVKTNQRSHK